MGRSSSAQKNVALKLAVAAVVGCGLSLFAITQEVPMDSHAAGPAKPVQVAHRAMNGKDLPAASAPMKIIAELPNSRLTDLSIRVVGSKDGRLIDIVMPRGELNPADNAEYVLTIPAPLAMMSYQFVIHQPDGSISSSKRYTVKRQCIQAFSVDDFKGEQDAEYKKQLGELVSEIKKLESNTASYDEAFKIIAEIKAGQAQS